MKYPKSVIIVLLFLTTSCGNHERVKANIFERREIEKDRLLIKYRYTVNGDSYTDSTIIKNVIIGNDSINVIINPSDPSKALPDLIKE